MLLLVCVSGQSPLPARPGTFLIKSWLVLSLSRSLQGPGGEGGRFGFEAILLNNLKMRDYLVNGETATKIKLVAIEYSYTLFCAKPLKLQFSSPMQVLQESFISVWIKIYPTDLFTISIWLRLETRDVLYQKGNKSIFIVLCKLDVLESKSILKQIWTLQRPLSSVFCQDANYFLSFLTKHLLRIICLKDISHFSFEVNKNSSMTNVNLKLTKKLDCPPSSDTKNLPWSDYNESYYAVLLGL